MGRLFTVDFEGSKYYMCKSCRTHIAVPEDPNAFPEPGRTLERFITVINVEMVNERRQLYNWMLEPHMVSDVYCIKCGEKLGIKIMCTCWDKGELRDYPQYLLGLGKLFLRNGDEIRDGDTLNVVGQAAHGYINML